MLFAIIASAMIVSHATYMAANRRSVGVRYEQVTLSQNFARSGLSDALQWYQKQPTQPVAQFAPRLEPLGDPPLLDTLDPTVGLVREFEVRGSLWARYEVRKDETFDISGQRGLTTPGSVWDVGSRGMLFERNDPAVGYDQLPNRVVASTYIRTEIQGLGFLPPAAAALVTGHADTMEIGANARIEGQGGIAIAHAVSAVAPLPAGTVDGGVVGIAGYDDSPGVVFGMPAGRARDLVDYVVDQATLDAARSSSSADPVQSLSAGISSLLGNGGDGQDPGATYGAGDLSWYWSTLSAFDAWWQSYGTGRSASWNTVSSSLDSIVARLTADAGTVTSATAGSDVGWITAGTAYVTGLGQTQSFRPRRDLESRSIFVDGNLLLDGSTPLSGTALILVSGNLLVDDTFKGDLRGIIYVRGNCKILGALTLAGTLVVRGTLALGTGTKPVVIRYDDVMVRELKRSLERYRRSRAVRPGWAVPQ